MRPIKLTVSAFGPYAGKTILELDKLGGEWALSDYRRYRCRKDYDFRCNYLCLVWRSQRKTVTVDVPFKYATPNIPTEVELVFSYAEKPYTVKRNPEYERPKSRGEGFTTQRQKRS